MVARHNIKGELSVLIGSCPLCAAVCDHVGKPQRFICRSIADNALDSEGLGMTPRSANHEAKDHEKEGLHLLVNSVMRLGL